MRLIDADLAIEQVKKSDLTSREKIALLLCLSDIPTVTLPPNDPLPLEQLREMDGGPVWTVTIGMEGLGRWELCTSKIVTVCPLHRVLRCVVATGEIMDYELDTYGKTWLAYRRKPEEETT